MKNRTDLPIQNFNGKDYHLYPGERYFTRGTKKLHREVWKCHNGEIEIGYNIHHINGISTDNRIENLEKLKSKIHLGKHQKEKLESNQEYKNRFISLGIEASKEWHKSERGLKWHSEHAIKIKFGYNRNYGIRQCDVCGVSFNATYHTHRFCSNSCKSKYRIISGMDNIQRSCIICGNDFTTNKYLKVKTCSKNCANTSMIRTRIIKSNTFQST